MVDQAGSGRVASVVFLLVADRDLVDRLEDLGLQDRSVALGISCEGSDQRVAEALVSAVVVDGVDVVHASVVERVRDWEADLCVQVVDRDSKVESALLKLLVMVTGFQCSMMTTTFQE